MSITVATLGTIITKIFTAIAERFAWYTMGRKQEQEKQINEQLETLKNNAQIDAAPPLARDDLFGAAGLRRPRRPPTIK